MSSNSVFGAIAILVLAAHVVALAWALWSPKRIGLLLSVNAAVSASVLATEAQRLRYILAAPPDGQLLALIAFELVVLAAALWAFRGRRLPIIVSCVAFGLHLCASVAAVLFVLTFRMTRLL